MAKHRRGRRTAPFRREMPLPPDNPDGEAFRLLQEFESGMIRERNVDFFLYLTSKRNSTQAAAELECLGMSVEVIQNARGNWLCLASRVMVPRLAAFAGMRRIFEDLADRYDGNYDGWESLILEPKNGLLNTLPPVDPPTLDLPPIPNSRFSRRDSLT